MIMDVGRVAHTFALTLVLAWFITPSGAQPNKPEVDRLADLWPALSACWQPPAGSHGMEITLRFSLTRQGAIPGEPRITYSKLNGPPEARRAFRNMAMAALEACTPVNLSDGLGGAIAGRPISIRFIGSGSTNSRMAEYSVSFTPVGPP